MSEYVINCPQCGGTLQVQDEWAGMKSECPICHTAIIIPFKTTPRPPSDHTVDQSATRQERFDTLQGTDSRDDAASQDFETCQENSGKGCFLNVLGILFYLAAVADFCLGNFCKIDLTGVRWSPLVLSGLGALCCHYARGDQNES